MTATYAFVPPAFGHVNPALAYLQEWAKRGHEVTCFCTEPFRDAIEGAGLKFVSIDEAMRRDYAGISTNMFDVAEWVLNDTAKIMPLLDAMDLPTPDFVVHDALALWGYLYAHKVGCPAATTIATFAFGVHDVLFSPRMMWRMLRMIPPAIPTILRAARVAIKLSREYGVVVPPGPRSLYNYEDLNFVFTSAQIQPRAAIYRKRFRFVGTAISDRKHSAPMPDLPQEGAIAYVSLGTLFNDRPEFYETVLDALAALPVHVLLSAGSDAAVERLGDGRPNCTIAASVPQLDVIERASIFVTHGGMNSANEGLYHGVPLLVVPQMAEQRFVGRRVQQLGVGLFCDPGHATVDHLRSLARRLLEDPSFRRNAAELSETLRAAGGPARACDETEAYLARR